MEEPEAYEGLPKAVYEKARRKDRSPFFERAFLSTMRSGNRPLSVLPVGWAVKPRSIPSEETEECVPEVRSTKEN
jgi:hypothetical protein